MSDDELVAVVRELGRKIDALRDDFEALAMRGRLSGGADDVQCNP